MSTRESEFDPRQEPDRIHGAAFWITAGVSFGVIAGSTLVAWAILARTSGPRRIPLHGSLPRPAPPEIGIVEQRLFDDPARGPELRTAQEKKLDSWGWIDQKQGLAHIPVDRAMKLVAQRTWEAL